MPVNEYKIVTVNRTSNKQEETDDKTGEKSVYALLWKDSCTYELGTIVSSTKDENAEPFTQVIRNDGPVCEIIATSANYFVINQRFKGSKKSLIDTCWLIK